jgi:FkbM family methyltransferase
MLKEKKLVIFGASIGTIQFINQYLLGIDIAYFCDNDRSKHNTKIFGISVESPVKLLSEDPQHIVVLIISDHNADILKQIREMGDFNCFVSHAMKAYERSIRCKYFWNNQNKINEVLQILTDDKSRYILNEIIIRFSYGNENFKDLTQPNADQINELFSEVPCKDEIVVDAGAADGDTLVKFIKLFGKTLKKIYCFEPAGKKLAQLWRKATDFSGIDISVKPYGLSNDNHVSTFCYLPERPGASFVCGKGIEEVQTNYEMEQTTIELRCLDDIIPPSEKVTFIKMDIEGSEYDAILGASRIIMNCRPRLAISIYHNAEDYLRIPLLIKNMVSDYKFYIRHHGPAYVDTILYCVPIVR